MKVLFVCHGNVGRSQVAQVCFGKLSQHEASCAGTAVDETLARQNITSRKMKDALSQRSAEYIRHEFGVDISERERRQHTKDQKLGSWLFGGYPGLPFAG